MASKPRSRKPSSATTADTQKPAASEPAVIRFMVAGQAGPASSSRGGMAGAAGGGATATDRDAHRVKAHVSLGALRSAGALHTLEARVEQDIVRLVLSDGGELRLHPRSAQTLLNGLAKQQVQRGAQSLPAMGPNDVLVQPELDWGHDDASGGGETLATRGETKPTLRIAAIDILGGILKDKAADLSAEALGNWIDGKVAPGVYALPRSGTLPMLGGTGQQALTALPVVASGQAILVLMHGTFVNTASTFGKLWQFSPEVVQSLFNAYGDAVYALEHHTITANPFANALPLAKALPDDAVLHLLTHSRGGLVAEVLARLADTQVLEQAMFDSIGGGLEHCWNDARELHDLLRRKRVRVQRVVRVACPARGTLLASGRLDVYLSALVWLLNKAAVPVLPQVLDFLDAVAQRRTDPTRWPGLQAMLPDSGLVRWLNQAGEAPIDGELRVVAGDLTADSISGFFKTLLADMYYWTDNDIVVNTSAMYGGTPRAGEASYLLHRSGEATHFAYFKNPETVKAVQDALIESRPAGFSTIGPLSWRGESSEGFRGLRAAGLASAPDAGKPALFVLPGMLGSHLKHGQDRLWLSLNTLGGLNRLAYKPDDGILADGALGFYYDELMQHLRATHEVIEFSYDWRRPLADAAKQLAQAVQQALDARQASGQPVRLLAHSMGGLVARTMALEAPTVWQNMMARDGARLLMLGTPNSGLWVPMQVLSGDDNMGNLITSIGAPLSDHAARQMMAELPGFIALQAGLLDAPLGLHQQATWQRLADDDLAFTRKQNWWNQWIFPSGDADNPPQPVYAWGVPSQAVLDLACAYRKRLDSEWARLLPKHAHQMLIVVGRARTTPAGFKVDAQQGFNYVDAPEGGDGRVPLSLARLPGVATWQAPDDHGNLPRLSSCFAAYEELLTQGRTTRLTALPERAQMPGATVEASRQRSADAQGMGAAPRQRLFRPARQSRQATPADTAQLLRGATGPMGARKTSRRRGVAPPLVVEVLNGNLTYVVDPLFLGHYTALSLTGSERAVDDQIGGTLDQALALQAGHYPESPGMHQAFVSLRGKGDSPQAKPPAAIVVGLGPEGKLTERLLTHSVRLAVIDWLQRQHEANSLLLGEGQVVPPIRIAATLMGSGGFGINPSISARAIAQAVVQANQQVARVGWAPVQQLTLIEMFLDRATYAWHELRLLSDAAIDASSALELRPLIAAGKGAKRRPLDSSYRGAEYELVRITGQGNGHIEFALDSRRARSEVREQSTQLALVQELVRNALQPDPESMAQLGRTLFHLLVPPGVEPYVRGQDRLLLNMNDSVAAIPWEMLDTPVDKRAGGAQAPWAVRTGLLRQLQTISEPGAGRYDALTDDHVLVIGDPKLTRSDYRQLQHAYTEAVEVADTLEADPDIGPTHLHRSLQASALDIVNALYDRAWRIVHLAGHGEWQDQHGGVVLSGPNTFLGPDEIKAMRAVPELVFINCCYLARLDSSPNANQAMASFGRGEFAAGVADALIRVGVRCVVAAGWAVDDRAARLFATTFYRHLLNGRCFGDAVTDARRTTYESEQLQTPPGNTWAAYQCYGDPAWRLRDPDGDAAAGPRKANDGPGQAELNQQRYGHIASAPALALALESLAVDARWTAKTQATALAQVRWLEQRFDPSFGDMGAVAEAFAVAYEECGDHDNAISHSARAVRAADGSASFKALERWANLRARRANEWSRGGGQPSYTPIEATPEAEARAATASLSHNAMLRNSSEAYCLLGSGCKRLAMIQQRLGEPASAVDEQLAAMKAAYAKGLELAQAENGNSQYPQQNLLALEVRRLLANAPATAKPCLMPADPGFMAAFDGCNQLLQAAQTDNPEDEWIRLGLVEQALITAIFTNDEKAFAAAQYALHDLKLRAPAPSLWRSSVDHWEFILGTTSQGAGHDRVQLLLAQLGQMAR